MNELTPMNPNINFDRIERIDARPRAALPFACTSSSNAIPSNNADNFMKLPSGPYHGSNCIIEQNDVLCGRDKMSHAHFGNKRFRKFIEMYRESYQTAPCRDTKTSITCHVIALVRGFGGRFLKLDEATGKWFVVGSNYAHEKVSHALRSAKDPNRPRIKRKRTSRTYTLTPTQEETYHRTLEDQQDIYQFFVKLESQGEHHLNVEDIDGMLSLMDQLPVSLRNRPMERSFMCDF